MFSNFINSNRFIEIIFYNVYEMSCFKTKLYNSHFRQCAFRFIKCLIRCHGMVFVYDNLACLIKLLSLSICLTTIKPLNDFLFKWSYVEIHDYDHCLREKVKMDPIDYDQSIISCDSIKMKISQKCLDLCIKNQLDFYFVGLIITWLNICYTLCVDLTEHFVL